MSKQTFKSVIGSGKTIAAGEQNEHKDAVTVQSYMWKSIEELIKQLAVSMLDRVEILFACNLTKNEIVLSPIRIQNSAIQSVGRKNKLPETYSFSEYVQHVAYNAGIIDAVAFIEYLDIERLTDSFKSGNTKLSSCFKMKDKLGNEKTIEQRVLLFVNDAIGDLMGITYALSKEKTDNDSINKRINEYNDFITGGYNRKGFVNAVEQFRDNGADLKEYAILYVNIKGFKVVNEVFGTGGGDKLLKDLYLRFVESELEPVIGGRMESDHFVFLIKQENMNFGILTDLSKFAWTDTDKERDVFIYCVNGIYNISVDDSSIYRMLDRAKLAKEHTTNQYVKPYAVFDSSMREDYIKHAEILSRFNSSIERNEFEVHYQPITDAFTKETVSAEALVRWRKPDGEYIQPSYFIPELEKSGYITRLDEFVSRVVSGFLHNRFDNGKPIIPVSINLSRVDFHDEEKVRITLEELEKSKLPKGTLRFEITETVYAALESKETEIVERLKRCGSLIYLDDFGSGYSYLSMLQNYKFDFLKIDMSFVRQLNSSPSVKAIVRTIISLCHELGIKVVAEGVETETEYNILKTLNCDYIQGYYFSKPLCSEEFNAYLDNKLNK